MAWTLCIEITFYVALPVFAFVAARCVAAPDSVRADVVLLVVLSAASLAYRAHYSSFFEAQKVSTLPGTFFWFALGMGMALASVAARGTASPRPIPAPDAGWPTLSWLAAALLFCSSTRSAQAQQRSGRRRRGVDPHAVWPGRVLHPAPGGVRRAPGAVPRRVRTYRARLGRPRLLRVLPVPHDRDRAARTSSRATPTSPARTCSSPSARWSSRSPARRRATTCSSGRDAHRRSSRRAPDVHVVRTITDMNLRERSSPLRCSMNRAAVASVLKP